MTEGAKTGTVQTLIHSMFLGELLKKNVRDKHGSGEWWLFALYIREKILKESFSSPETAGQILK